MIDKTIAFLYKTILHFKYQIRQTNDIIDIMTNNCYNSFLKNDYEFIIKESGISYTGMRTKRR